MSSSATATPAATDGSRTPRNRRGSSVVGASEPATRWNSTLIERLRSPIPGDEINSWLISIGVTLMAFLVRIVGLSRPTGLTFDETYYVKDAWSLWNGGGFERQWPDNVDGQFLAGDYSALEPQGSFIAHPPLGKWLIGVGGELFGWDSFGWRFMSVLFGALMILAVIRLTRRLARSTMIGVVAGILLCFDGLHFVMSRIALLDIFQACFLVAAVAALVVDRDWFRNRLADHLVAGGFARLDGSGSGSVSSGFGPIVLWRPWRLVAGILFGLSIAVKWNSIYVLAAFSVLSVFWDVGARRLAGAGPQAWRSLYLDGPVAFVHHVVVAVIVYVVSWSGWLFSAGGYNRDWGASNPDSLRVKFFGETLASLLEYHKAIFDFHTGDGIRTSTHPYQSKPGGWLFIARPIGIDAVNGIKPGTDGCPDSATSDCVRVISAIGTPILWWVGVFALIAAVLLWIGNRDWRFGVPIVGLASVWLTWFPNSERPIFFFYAICIIPFTVIALALCIGKLVGQPDSRWRRPAAIGCGVFVALVICNFAFFYPILTDALLTNEQWTARMWFQRWI